MAGNEASSIRNDQVQPRKACDGGGHGRGDLGRVRHIYVHAQAVRACLLDRLHNIVCRVGMVGERDVIPALGEPFRNSLSNSNGRAGDESYGSTAGFRHDVDLLSERFARVLAVGYAHLLTYRYGVTLGSSTFALVTATTGVNCWYFTSAALVVPRISSPSSFVPW